MEYSRIIAITGLPGLFELVSSKTDGAIVRSLDDRTTRFVSSRIHHFSHLESIEVYTVRENVNLAEVFNAMAASHEPLPDGKDSAGLRRYFEKVYPDLDFDRVYTSDLKKMVRWLEILQKNNIEIRLSEPGLPAEEESHPEAAETAAADSGAGRAARAKAPAGEDKALESAGSVEQGQASKKKAAGSTKQTQEAPAAKKKAAEAGRKTEKAETTTTKKAPAKSAKKQAGSSGDEGAGTAKRDSKTGTAKKTSTAAKSGKDEKSTREPAKKQAAKKK